MSNGVDANLDELRTAIQAAVFLPGDAGWDEARQPWNQHVRQHPAAVVFPESAADVARVVAFAKERDLDVTAQGVGHGAGTMPPLEDTILLRTTQLTGLEVDPSARRASIGAGVVWEQVAARAAESGLAGLAGTAPDINVVGYTLGGGLGWLGRKHGFAANSVVALEVVDADGRIRRVDAASDPDLYWALRGGGGSFAIVTGLEFDLFPVPQVFAGVRFWVGDRAKDLLSLYASWITTVPDELTSQARFLRVPPLPFIPETLHDRFAIGIEACYMGPASEASELLGHFGELGEPILDTFAEMSPANLGQVHYDPPVPVPGIGHHALLPELTEGAIESLLEHDGPGAESPLVSIELRQLGGALGRTDPEHGALDALEEQILVFGLGVPENESHAEAISEHLTKLIDGVRPWATSRGYFNFAEQPCDAGTLYPEGTYRRLCEVKAACDPDNVFRSNQQIAAAPVT
jgi:FAD binding domain/Berberine and berberine like